MSFFGAVSQRSTVLAPMRPWGVAVMLVVVARTTVACGGAGAQQAEKGQRITAESDVVAASPAASGAREVDPHRAPAPLEVPRPVLDRVIADGPGALLARVPLEPVFDKSRRFVGFRILELFDGQPAVTRFGIRPGDIFVGITGQRIVTPDSLMIAFDKLRDADALEIRVLRGAEVKDFRFPIVDAP